MLTRNNQIVDVVQPAAVRGQSDERFQPADGVPPRRAEIDASAAAVPGDRAKRSLPIHCFVEWEASKLRGDPAVRQWLRVGRCSLETTAHIERFVLRAGCLVRFKKQPPGKEGVWYTVESIVPSMAPYAGGLSTLDCELSEASSDFNGAGA